MPFTLPIASVYTDENVTALAIKQADTALFGFLTDHLGPNSNVMTNGPRVMGLSGTPNSSNPAHLYDLQANMVTMRNALGATVTLSNTALLTNNKLSVGANGRDTSAALSTSNPFVYLYFIWNGSTLATLASNTGPAIGPALPSGYTHWAFATVIPVNSASPVEYHRVISRGSRVYYDTGLGGVSRILAGGQANAYTALTYINLVPSIATSLDLLVSISLTSAVTATYNLYVRGAAQTSDMASMGLSVAAGTSGAASIPMRIPGAPSGTTFSYKLSQAPSSGGAFIDIAGFAIPNGDAS
jgi:hypothetical protein